MIRRRITEIANFAPLDTSLKTLTHQFVQRCSKSGTAKGKAKIKAGQTLKKSKMTKNKPTAEPATGGVFRKTELEQMIDDCLNAPTPLRHLSPKEKAREAEREKLGLISKDRQREIDMLKKQAKNKGKEESGCVMGTPGLDFITLGMVDAELIPKYELTVEDGRRLASEYSRVLMRRHRARQAAETTLLRLKKEAIEALPEHLKAAALVPDMTPFPPDRYMATFTPPIEGYAEKLREAAKHDSGRQKLR